MKLLCTASYVYTRSLVEDDSGHIFELNQDNLGNYYFWDTPTENESDEDHQKELRALAADPLAWDEDCAREFSSVAVFGDETENWRTGKPAKE